MITAIIIVLVLAVMTLLAVLRAALKDLRYFKRQSQKLETWYGEICEVLHRERLESAQDKKRVADQVNAERDTDRESAAELSRQVKEHVLPMILILRPMLSALEAMELPEFEDGRAEQ